MVSIPNFFRQAANLMRDVTLTPEELAFRETLKTKLPLFRLAAVVSVAVSALFFIAFPNFFTAVVLAGHAYAAFEFYHLTTNFLDTLNNALVEFQAGWSGDRIQAVTKNAPIARMALRAIVAYVTQRQEAAFVAALNALRQQDAAH